MAQRKDKPVQTPPAQQAVTSSTDTVEDRVLAFAEQLGRIAGTVQARADGWLDRTTLNEQLTRVRDGAAELLNHLATGLTSDAATAAQDQTASNARGRSSNPAAATGRSGGKVDAPGKKHRKPPARARAVKHSDETISKGKGAQTMRRGRRRG
jgi:hypothetical protein